MSERDTADYDAPEPWCDVCDQWPHTLDCPGMPTVENDAGDWHTIDVGYVHTLTDDGECRPDCPHPDHRVIPPAVTHDEADA